MPRHILSKAEASAELSAFAKAARDAEKRLDKIFEQSSGEMRRRLEDGNNFSIDLRSAVQAALKLADQFADEAEMEREPA